MTTILKIIVEEDLTLSWKCPLASRKRHEVTETVLEIKFLMSKKEMLTKKKTKR